MAEQMWRSGLVGRRKITTSSAYIEGRCLGPEVARAEKRPSATAFSIIRRSISMTE
jgi:hypothetical protein